MGWECDSMNGHKRRSHSRMYGREREVWGKRFDELPDTATSPCHHAVPRLVGKGNEPGTRYHQRARTAAIPRHAEDGRVGPSGIGIEVL